MRTLYHFVKSPARDALLGFCMGPVLIFALTHLHATLVYIHAIQGGAA